MAVLTIPKNITKREELVVIPRKDYEAFSEWKETVKKYKTFTLTKAQKVDLKKAREDYKKGNYLTMYELKQKLGIKN